MIDRAFRICSTDGNEHNRIDLTSKKEYGGDRVVYHRQDLHSVLKATATSLSTTSSGAVIRVSSRVISADCEAGSVILEGGEILRFVSTSPFTRPFEKLPSVCPRRPRNSACQ